MREAKSQRRGPGRAEQRGVFQLAQPRVEVGGVGLAANQEVTLDLDADCRRAAERIGGARRESPELRIEEMHDPAR